MRTPRFFITACILLGLMLILLSIGAAAAQDEATAIRWDIISVTVNEEGLVVVDAGAPAYARANDGSTIMIKGSGTFGPGTSDPVTGGGEWMTWDYDENETGNGVFTVTGFVSYAEAPGVLPAEFVVDEIGDNENIRAGVAVLSVAYSNEDGTSAGSGILVISCRLIETPASVLEGVAVTMGFVAFPYTVVPVPGLDASHTSFHVVP